MKDKYWPDKSETKYHFQPDVKFKDEFVYEADKEKYLACRDKTLKKSKWKKIEVCFEE